MIGIILSAIAGLCDEFATIIGKDKVSKGEETTYSMAFLSLVFGTFWFLLIILWKGEFLFSLSSLPYFIPRVLFEILLVHVTTLAIARSDRSTFGFTRTLAIPLLLLVDVFLGYALSPGQFVGIALIIAALFIAFVNHGIKKTALNLVLVSSIVPVITISLYKYNITHFNSVEAEQFVSNFFLVIYSFFIALYIGKENPLKLLRKPIFFLQAFLHGLSAVAFSFAFLFAPASVLTAAKRSAGTLFAVFGGAIYFNETHIALKILVALFLTGGIVLLVI